MMKKISGIMAVMLCIVLMSAPAQLKAAASGVSLTGPGTVRAGDVISIQITISESGANAIEGTLSYDGSQVTLNGITVNMTGWKAETNGNIFMAYDENMSNPVKSAVTVATAVFTVNKSLPAGTAVSISLKDTVLAKSSESVDKGTVTYSVKTAQPLSGNNSLASLNVEGFNLSPAFNSDTMSYSIGEADYDISSLKINAAASDGRASVSISGNSLAVGSNTVSITVKAENGSTRTYTITAVRKQDPAYVPSDNADILTIYTDTGSVSPAFSSDVTEYVIYVPYEYAGRQFSIGGTPADAKARGVKQGIISSLEEGTNRTVLKCTAEDGTVKEYNINIVVMPEYNGEIPKIEGVERKETVETTETETETETTENRTEPETECTDVHVTSEGIPAWIIALTAAISISAGFGVCYLMLVRKGKGGTKDE